MSILRDALSKYQPLITSYINNTYAKSTAAGYRSCLKAICEDISENYKFEEMVYSDLVELITNWQEQYTNKTISNRLIVLRKLLEMAYNDNVFQKDMSKMIKGLKADTQLEEQKPFSKTDFDKMESTSTTQPSGKNLALLGKETGLRIQELIGLCWSDINFKERTLSVCRVCTLKEFKQPKTKQSFRIIPLTDKALEVLHAQFSLTGANEYIQIMIRDQSKKARTTHAFTPVFIDDLTGKYFTDSKDYAQRFFTKFLIAAGLEHRGPSQLRHSFASIAISAGIPVKLISQMMGHADSSVTERHYAHLLPECRENMQTLLNEALSSAQPKNSRVQNVSPFKSGESKPKSTSLIGKLKSTLKLFSMLPSLVTLSS
ncbi:tyrosine-type recombinase/integrase [Vibrio sp. FJH11]